MSRRRWPNPFAQADINGDGASSLWVGDRLARYALVGGSGVFVNLGTLFVLVEAFSWSPAVAAILAIETSILSNYTLNRFWTWRDRGPVAFSIGRYHAVSLVGMAIQWACLAVGYYVFGLYYLLAALIGIVVAMGWTFFSNDRFTFATLKKPVSPSRPLLYGGALLLHFVVAALLTHSWDTFVFQRTVTDLFSTGMTPYTAGSTGADHLFLGRHLPVQQHWFAYPPLTLLLLATSYSPVAWGLVESPWLGRILIKLPAILGTVVLAGVARRLVVTAGRDAPKAIESGNRVERWLLFNPLFILIAGVWGQMEALIVLLLVLSVLVLRTRRWALSGAFWGLAVLVKPFAVFLIPVLWIHLARNGGKQAALSYFGTGLGVAALASLPFFLLDPGGFLRQTVLMHMDRPPSRYSPFAVIYYLFREGAHMWPGVMPEPLGVASVIGTVSLVATVLVLAGLAVAAARRPATEGNLLFWMGASMLGGLMAGKVLNEQYLVLPLGLLAIWMFHPASNRLQGRRVRWFLLVGTWGMVVAALLERAAFVHFIPEDILRMVFDGTVLDLYARIAWGLGFTLASFRLLLGAVAVVCLLACFVTAAWLVVPALREGWGATLHYGAGLLPSATVAARALAVMVVLLLLVAYPVATAFMAPGGNGIGPVDNGNEEERVFALYRTDWYNPGHDPLRPEGSWGQAVLEPESGYHNINAHKATKDLTRLKQAGVDGVLITLHPYTLQSAATVQRIAEAMEVPYAMVLDFGAMQEHHAGDAWGGWSMERIREVVTGPPLVGWDGPHHMRDTETRLPYLFVREHHRVQSTVDEGMLEAGIGSGAGNHLVFVNETPRLEDAMPENRTAAGIKGALWLTGAPWDGQGYQDAWDHAVAQGASAVVIPWNEFDRAQAVEPTKEHGDTFLELTRQGSARLHGAP